MNYIVFVTGAPYGTQNSVTAYLFVKSVFLLHHYVKKIFFYSSGVYNANSMIFPSLDEFNILHAWIRLKKKYSCKLCVCPSSSYRRGVLSNKSAIKYGCLQGNFSSHFQWMSSSEMAFNIHHGDRIVQF
ncbi:sulfurtransferase complex subunit TusD [Buchnera aphidicola]|uniref:sulfurtransferase complex subunit TusD n=1 Tax=Buchnera aphidicola TaxID=9 RepID=UPI00094CE7F2|nr:sulfurtransferase complex subunit TusD [Buchnera aphidicola]